MKNFCIKKSAFWGNSLTGRKKVRMYRYFFLKVPAYYNAVDVFITVGCDSCNVHEYRLFFFNNNSSIPKVFIKVNFFE